MSWHHDHPKIRPLAERVGELEDELRQASAEVTSLEDGYAVAHKFDIAREAAARREGKEPPAEKERAAPAVLEEVELARRDVEVLQTAVEAQRRLVAEAVEEHREQWTADVERRITRTFTKARKSLEDFAANLDALGGLYVLRAQVQGEPTGVPVFLVHSPTLRAPSGEPLHVPAMVQDLRAILGEEPDFPVRRETEGERTQRSIQEAIELTQRAARNRGVSVGSLADKPRHLIEEWAGGTPRAAA